VTSHNQPLPPRPRWHSASWWASVGAIAGVVGALIAVLTYCASRPSPNRVSSNASAPAQQAARPTVQPGTESAPDDDLAIVDATEPPVTTEPPESHEPVAIEAVTIEAGDYKKIGKGLYQLSGSRSVAVRYWWTTISNYGEVEGTDCTVVSRVTDVQTGALHDTYRTATCSLKGWSEAVVAEGHWRIAVTVKLDSGATGEGVWDFEVVP
jgi:hypothetical protein